MAMATRTCGHDTFTPVPGCDECRVDRTAHEDAGEVGAEALGAYQQYVEDGEADYGLLLTIAENLADALAECADLVAG